MSKMTMGVRSYECIYCGVRFTRSDSIANNTPELMSNMYCSRECHDKDTEQIEEGIKSLRVEDTSDVDTVVANTTDSKNYNVVEVGGFRLKVPINNSGSAVKKQGGIGE